MRPAEANRIAPRMLSMISTRKKIPIASSPFFLIPNCLDD